MITISLQQIREAAIKDELHTTRLSSLVAELEETKQSLEKAREESQMMANCLASLKEELEQTKMELIQLKASQSNKQTQLSYSDIEDLKFVEDDAPKVEIKIESPMISQESEFQKKKSVKFSNPSALTQIINPNQEQFLERQFSADRETMQTKKKKKHLMPLIAGIFSKKKAYHQDGASSRTPS